VARTMNSAATRLRGSSVFCLREASWSSFLRACSVACGVLRRMTRRSGNGGASGPRLACTITSCGSRSSGRVLRWVIRSKAVRSGRLRLKLRQPTPDNEVRLPGAVLEETVQAGGGGVVAIADADLARDRRATVDGLAASLVGHLQVGEAAAAEIVNRMHPPI